MLLNELFSEYADAPAVAYGELRLNSRAVMPGDVFFALRGMRHDGRQFIADAVASGAIAIVYEADDGFVWRATNKDVVGLPVVELQQKLSAIAAKHYQYPADKLTMIGITGTNGKTSTCQFVAEGMMLAGERSATVGTLGAGFYGSITPGQHTTPDAISLQKTLARLFGQGAATVAMEVSSHALVQHRVAAVKYDIGVFTNLTRDHLDYHPDMQSYAAAKAKLFQQPGMRYAIVNLDDEYAQWFIDGLPASVQSIGISMQSVPRRIPVMVMTDIESSESGYRAKIQSPWGEEELHSHLWGRFNLQNQLTSIAVLCAAGIPLRNSVQYISRVHAVPGRMERFGGVDKQPHVVVDYAHTPDALAQALNAMREHCRGELWCVFGCGGDRDQGKRPLMGRVAEQYADHVVVTDDNPRSEDPAQIVADISRGLFDKTKTHYEHDRSKAIRYALERAQRGDAVLVAGKGHEQYQIIGEQQLPFSDQAEVVEMLGC